MIPFTTGHVLYDDEGSEADQHVQGGVGHLQAELLLYEQSQQKEEEEEEELQCGGLHC